MGKRSRRQQRTGAGARVAPPTPSQGRRAGLRAGRPSSAAAPARPKAPWHPFPLVELCVLIGLVLIIVGSFSLGSRRGSILILCGLSLGSLAGLDTVLRDHFAGVKNHAGVIAATPAVAVAAFLYFTRAPWIVLVAAVVLVFAGAFIALRRAFARRSEGVTRR